MSSKTSPAHNSPVHPLVGTFIDGGSLELVEVLGVGGYGVVYRAIDARHPSGPKSYAVKCLVTSGHQTPRQRQIHIREIALHQLASAHPGVATLHRVVEHGSHTYIIMDYAPDHDLFTQILHSCRYLGDDGLIKDVFLQLLDAVEYCHSLGIYHRDLKPENILCFDDGLRIAITDFGLATTDKLSDEFRTGSVYHMSPECQGGEFAPTGNYSPMFNDIWSLGIILLNLATGRNPWKSATPGDPTFQAYLRDPMNFLPSVLPISPEVNEILVRMLEVDWRERMTLREVRYAFEEVTNFYSDGVVFEGSMARCPWEQGMEIDSSSSGTNPDEVDPQSPPAQSESHFPEDVIQAHEHLDSHWSKDSSSDIIFAAQSLAEGSSYGAPWTTYSSCGATWGVESPGVSSSSSEHDHYPMDLFDRTRTPALTQSPGSSPPTTPNSFDTSFGARLSTDVKPEQRSGNVFGGLGLMINTNIPRPRIYDYDAANPSIENSFSNGTSIMHTAIEYDPYSSMFYLNSPIVHSPEKAIMMPDSAITAVGEDKEMTSPSVWTSSSATEMSSPSSYSDSSPSSSIRGEDLEFRRSTTPSPEPYAIWTMFPPSHHIQVQSTPPAQCQLSSSISTSITDVVLSHSRPSNPLFVAKSSKRCDTSAVSNVASPLTVASPSPAHNNIISAKSPTKTFTRLAIKLFPRPSSPAPAHAAPATASTSRCDDAAIDAPRPPPARRQTAPATPEQAAWGSSQVAKDTQQQIWQAHYGGAETDMRDLDESYRHHAQQQQQLRSPKLWFMPGRFRASTGVN